MGARTRVEDRHFTGHLASANQPKEPPQRPRMSHATVRIAQGFRDERDVALLKIADAAVNELGAPARSALREIVLFNKGGAVSARCCLHRGTEAGRAAANNENVPGGGGVVELGDGFGAVHCR